MEVKSGRNFIGRFLYQADLLQSLTDLCLKEGISLGVFNLVGAVTCAKMGYYDQENKIYINCLDLKKKLEITGCMGNISLKDKKPFVHAHITLADHEGKCYGGHLMPGTKIFAAEYFVRELTGAEFERKPDPDTGLSLWP